VEKKDVYGKGRHDSASRGGSLGRGKRVEFGSPFDRGGLEREKKFQMKIEQ